MNILSRCAGEAVADGRLILRKRNGESCQVTREIVFSMSITRHQADKNGEEKCRLKTVELGGLKPMVEHLKSEELDVAGKAAYCIACHALDSPVRLGIHILGGVALLLQLMSNKNADDGVVNQAALALSTVLQHVEAKDELYRLKGMKVLIDQGLMSDSVDVQVSC